MCQTLDLLHYAEEVVPSIPDEKDVEISVGAWGEARVLCLQAEGSFNKEWIPIDPSHTGLYAAKLGNDGQPIIFDRALGIRSNSLTKWKRTISEHGERVSSAEKLAVSAAHDPYASALKSAEWFSNFISKLAVSSSQRSADQAARLIAKYPNLLATGRTHKALLYGAKLVSPRAWADGHGSADQPLVYIGISCIMAVHVGAGGDAVTFTPLIEVFNRRRARHLYDAERTTQDFSFQVMLQVYGQESFSWEPYWYYPHEPRFDEGPIPMPTTEEEELAVMCTVEEGKAWAAKWERACIDFHGGPYLKGGTLNLTSGGEGTSSSGLMESGESFLLRSAGAFATVLVLWSQCMDDPKLQLQNAKLQYPSGTINVGHLWHSIRAQHAFVKGYPDRVTALTEMGFSWDLDEDAANAFVKQITAIIKDQGDMWVHGKGDPGPALNTNLAKGVLITGRPWLVELLIDLGVQPGKWCAFVPKFAYLASAAANEHKAAERDRERSGRKRPADDSAQAKANAKAREAEYPKVVLRLRMQDAVS